LNFGVMTEQPEQGLAKYPLRGNTLMANPPLPPAERDHDANPPAKLQAAFGKNVRRLRLQLGLKQSELSERCGVDQSVISKIERGELNLTIKQMSRLADALEGDVITMLKSMPERGG